MDPAGHEMKHGAAFHGEGWPGMMRQHENRRVIGRVVAPPAFPALVRPLATDGSEHVPPENPCTDIGDAARGEIIIDASFPAALAPMHGAAGAGRNEPFMQG